MVVFGMYGVSNCDAKKQTSHVSRTDALSTLIATCMTHSR